MTSHVPTVDQVLAESAIGNGFHDFDVEGGRIRLTTKELRQALEVAYDATNPYWDNFVDLEDKTDCLIPSPYRLDGGIFTAVDQVKCRWNITTVPADDQGRQFWAYGTGAPTQRAMTAEELISWANGNYHIR